MQLHIAPILGGAIGDALGVTQEIFPRFRDLDEIQQQVISSRRAVPQTDYEGNGPWSNLRLAPGEWTDDTAMMLCLADSLIDCKKLDVADLMRKFVMWLETGYNSSKPFAIGIGGNIMRSLMRFNERHPYKLCGGRDPDTDAGNGSLMRLAPVPVFWRNDLKAALDAARLQTQTTHNVPETIDGSALMAFIIWHGLNGMQKTEIFAKLRECPDLTHAGIIELTYENAAWKTKTADEIRTLPGRCLWSLEAALWCVYNSDNFEEAVIRAVNLSGDADTVGSITGQIAGAIWGLNSIPQRWIDGLAQKEHIISVASSL